MGIRNIVFVQMPRKPKVKRHVSLLNNTDDLELTVCEDTCCADKGVFVHCPLCKRESFNQCDITKHVHEKHIANAVKTPGRLLKTEMKIFSFIYSLILTCLSEPIFWKSSFELCVFVFYCSAYLV